MADVNLSPDSAIPITDCRLPLRYPESSCDEDLSTRLLWNNLNSEVPCTSIIKWVFNEIQTDIYKIAIYVYNEFGYAFLEKIEASIDDINYTEIWAGHKSLESDNSVEFSAQPIKSAKLTFWMDLGTRPGIAEIYFIKPLSEICSWIDAKGGASGLSIIEVFEIVDSYLAQSPPAGYSFVPTLQNIFGVIDYYLGFDGDAATGCNYF